MKVESKNENKEPKNKIFISDIQTKPQIDGNTEKTGDDSESDDNSMDLDNNIFSPKNCKNKNSVSEDDDKTKTSTKTSSNKNGNDENKEKSNSNKGESNKNSLTENIILMPSEKNQKNYKEKNNPDTDNFINMPCSNNINLDDNKPGNEANSNNHKNKIFYKSDTYGENEKKKAKIKYDEKNVIANKEKSSCEQKDETYEEESEESDDNEEKNEDEDEDDDDENDGNQGYQQVYKIDDRLIKEDNKNDDEKTRASTKKKETNEFKLEYKPGTEYIPSKYRQKNFDEKNNISNDNANDGSANKKELNIKNSVDFKPNDTKTINYNSIPFNINANINHNFTNPFLLNPFTNCFGFNGNFMNNYYLFYNNLLNLNDKNNMNNQNNVNYTNNMMSSLKMNNNMMNMLNMNNNFNNLIPYINSNSYNLINNQIDDKAMDGNNINNTLKTQGQQQLNNPMNKSININMDSILFPPNLMNNQNPFAPTKNKIVRKEESGIPGYKKVVTLEYKCSLVKDDNNEKINSSNIKNKNSKNNKKKKGK